MCPPMHYIDRCTASTYHQIGVTYSNVFGSYWPTHFLSISYRASIPNFHSDAARIEVAGARTWSRHNTTLSISCWTVECLLQANVGRYTTGVWTRQYLEQQLVMILAGRAAEELVFGREEMSSLHQHKIMQARQVWG